MEFITFRLTLCTSACALLTWFGWKLYRHRLWINGLRGAGVPMPAWSWISGHILHLYSHVRQLPPYANVNLAFTSMSADFADDGMFLVDLWPAADPMLVVFSPEAAVKVCQKLNLPKGKKNETMIRPITGGLTLLSMNGDEWKTWRGLFNPGFSQSLIMEQVPQIVDSASRFCEKLSNCAGKGIIRLDELTTELTFEVILKVSLDVDVGQKYKEHIFVNAMDKIVKWHSFWDPLVLLNPLRILIQWHCGRVVDSWLRKELEQRYDELRKESQGKPSLKFEKHRPRSVMDLAIKAYTEGKDANDIQKLDAQFVHMACHQIRLFLFAGNDSTSSTIVFAYHLLFKHPVALAKIQKEHDEVFGQDPAQAAIMLKEKPSLLHKCKYTLAVAKETLRLYPPAATMRMGLPGTSLATQRGVSFPIDHLTVLITHHALHHNERVWPRADEFVPERWLVDAEHELYPQSSAWRAFEVGPRNCIGQNLSINEIKVTLVMTIRSFVISPAYYELDEMQASQNVLLGWLPQWTYRSPRPEKTYKGDRAFPTEKAGAHPSEGYPCRVDLRR